MQSLFESKPVLLNVIRVGIAAFMVLSLVNLYYSIKVNRSLLDKKQDKI